MRVWRLPMVVQPIQPTKQLVQMLQAASMERLELKKHVKNAAEVNTEQKTKKTNTFVQAVQNVPPTRCGPAMVAILTTAGGK